MTLEITQPRNSQLANFDKVGNGKRDITADDIEAMNATAVGTNGNTGEQPKLTLEPPMTTMLFSHSEDA